MQTDQVFTALANSARRELLRLLLAEDDQPAGRLADHFSLSRPTVSEHLRVLRDAGLVTERRQGRERLYSLDPQPLKDLCDWLAPYL